MCLCGVKWELCPTCSGSYKLRINCATCAGSGVKAVQGPCTCDVTAPGVVNSRSAVGAGN
ncbi:hypothetical protein VTL71DRAFT_10568 [Oculimacula yallundae]|uniref:Uncharacterized protein n=1 Tax=Oculimacula yallundae TaxID=86028 RepID=A0ABR4CTM4_9HELO